MFYKTPKTNIKDNVIHPQCTVVLKDLFHKIKSYPIRTKFIEIKIYNYKFVNKINNYQKFSF